MITSDLSKLESNLVEYASSQSEKFGVVKFDDKTFIIVIEAQGVDHYYLEEISINNYLIPVIWFEPGRYRTFPNSGLFTNVNADPQLQSLAAVVDLHLGSQHFFE